MLRGKFCAFCVPLSKVCLSDNNPVQSSLVPLSAPMPVPSACSLCQSAMAVVGQDEPWGCGGLCPGWPSSEVRLKRRCLSGCPSGAKGECWTKEQVQSVMRWS